MKIWITYLPRHGTQINRAHTIQSNVSPQEAADSYAGSRQVKHCMARTPFRNGIPAKCRLPHSISPSNNIHFVVKDACARRKKRREFWLLLMLPGCVPSICKWCLKTRQTWPENGGWWDRCRDSMGALATTFSTFYARLESGEHNRNDKTIDYLEIGFLCFDLIGFTIQTFSGRSTFSFSFLHFSRFSIYFHKQNAVTDTASVSIQCNVSHICESESVRLLSGPFCSLSHFIRLTNQTVIFYL